MARGDQLGRQWRIIQTLISSRMGNSAAELASQLDCHARTVYRDLLLYPIIAIPADVLEDVSYLIVFMKACTKVTRDRIILEYSFILKKGCAQ